MPNLTWKPDIQESAAGDPYCDWLCGHGSAFAVRNRIRGKRQSPKDFAAMFDIFEKGENVNVTVALPDKNGEVEPRNDEAIRFPSPLRHRSLSEKDRSKHPGPWKPPQHLMELPDAEKSKIVVVAVIDDGINIANERFVDAQGRSRIDFAWVQDGPLRGDVFFGREYRAAEIDRVRRASRDPVVVLEALGLVDFSLPGATALARRASHGTHMADLAAGYGPGDTGYEEANLRRIITVQLPFLMTQDTSGSTYSPFLASAVEFVIERAGLIRRELGLDRLPVVINLSYATSAGPHDGHDRVERIIKKMLKTKSKESGVQAQIVLPAGNRHLARQHAVAVSKAPELTKLEMSWRIQPGDQTASFLEVWVPEKTDPELTITLPGSTASSTVSLQGAQVLKDIPSDHVIARVNCDKGGRDGKRLRILIAVAPTEIYDSNREPAPAGIWNVVVSARLQEDQRIEAWIQRDESPYRYRTNARQSYLDDPKYQRFTDDGHLQTEDKGESQVKRTGSQSGMATDDSFIVVGGYVELSGDAASYSASGDENGSPGARGPTLMAVSDRSKSQPGVLASGTLTGTALPINGTSVAAPQVTRLLADEMARGTLTFQAAKGTLTDSVGVREALADDQRVRRGERSSTRRTGAEYLPEVPSRRRGAGRLKPAKDKKRSLRT